MGRQPQRRAAREGQPTSTCSPTRPTPPRGVTTPRLELFFALNARKAKAATTAERESNID